MDESSPDSAEPFVNVIEHDGGPELYAQLDGPISGLSPTWTAVHDEDVIEVTGAGLKQAAQGLGVLVNVATKGDTHLGLLLKKAHSAKPNIPTVAKAMNVKK